MQHSVYFSEAFAQAQRQARIDLGREPKAAEIAWMAFRDAARLLGRLPVSDGAHVVALKGLNGTPQTTSYIAPR